MKAVDVAVQLLEEIEQYWSTRTEGYWDVNKKELAGMQNEAWFRILEEHFPKKSKDELRILDVGTGPGFFPILLASRGYHVTGVDYTAAMLHKARENVMAQGTDVSSRVRFEQMDAQNLKFEDGSFDVVISRNLTWNLEKPQVAYREWYRVLDRHGVLLNFDANWYGYLNDEEKRKAYEQDRENVRRHGLDDHYLCTDIDTMENIAARVPLSFIQRPQWDVEILGKLGFSVLKTDEEVWKRVWSQEEKLNYGSTPMFMIYGEK